MIDVTVTGYSGDRLVVAAERRPACGRCLDGRGCGMGLLARRSDLPVSLTLEAPEPRPAIGSSIRLVASPGVLSAALLGYGLPLAGVLAAAASGPLAAALGLAAGIVAARTLARGRVGWQVAVRDPAR